LNEPKRNIVVIKLSGSIFFSDEFKRIIRGLSSVARSRKDTFLVLVAGGGPTARKYIAAGRAVGADQASLDEIGIEVSRLNAFSTIVAFKGLAFDSVPATLGGVAEAVDGLGEKKDKWIVVCGGLHPGQSTNAVAALIAEKTGAAEFINSTDVDGVYTEDPARSSNARRLDAVTPKQLEEILGNESMQAGGYDLMDPVALKLISRSKIPTKIVKCDAESLTRALAGDETGTRIVF
jgi:uridylate kinase